MVVHTVVTSVLCEYAIVAYLAYFPKVCISYNFLHKLSLSMALIFFVPFPWPDSAYFHGIFRLVTVCTFLTNCHTVTLQALPGFSQQVSLLRVIRSGSGRKEIPV